MCWYLEEEEMSKITPISSNITQDEDRKNLNLSKNRTKEKAIESDNEDSDEDEYEYEEEELYVLVECEDFENVNIFSPLNAFKEVEEKSIIEQETEKCYNSCHKEIHVEMLSSVLQEEGERSDGSSLGKAIITLDNHQRFEGKLLPTFGTNLLVDQDEFMKVYNLKHRKNVQEENIRGETKRNNNITQERNQNNTKDENEEANKMDTLMDKTISIVHDSIIFSKSSLAHQSGI